MGRNTHVSQTPRRTRDLSASSSLFKKLGPRVFSGLNSVPQKLSPPRTSACDLVWNKAFEMKSPWVKFGPKPKVGVLIRGKKKASFLHASCDTEKAEAEIGVMQPQAKDLEELLGARRGMEGFFPGVSRGRTALPAHTLVSDSWLPEL